MPLGKSLTTAQLFLKTPQQASPRRAFYNHPKRNITRLAAYTSLFQTSGTFPTVRGDLDVRWPTHHPEAGPQLTFLCT